MKFLSSIASIAEKYDAFLLDLWGVIHDGQQLYPNVKECLINLHKKDKKIVLLSNAPRRSLIVQQALEAMGISHDMYEAIVTSGETAYHCLAHPESSFFKPRGKKYIYIGLEKDRRILNGLHYEEAEHPEFAQFILLAHSFYDNQPIGELMPILEQCLALGLPLLCINPDKEVVRLGGERVYCAGLIAEKYRMMGGEVIYFGKPHRAVYEACMQVLPGIEKSRIMAIGDGLKTDIEGAKKSGIDCTLVTGGVLKDTVGKPEDKGYADKCKSLFEQENISPDMVVPVFNW
jgi:HAD superfamily hydrolase (TIGR01459 family)